MTRFGTASFCQVLALAKPWILAGAATLLPCCYLARSTQAGVLTTGGKYLLDIDGDGVVDIFDNAPTLPNSSQVDSDGDGVGDAADGFSFSFDGDLDGDAVINAKDPDLDGDGIKDGLDPFPFEASEGTLSLDFGGPYTVVSGSPLSLTFTAIPGLPRTFEDFLIIELDLFNDDDGKVSTEMHRAWWSGPLTSTIDLTWSDVKTLGLDSGTHKLRARAQLYGWSSNFADTTITAADVSAVPEPSSLALLAIGGFGLAAIAVRRPRPETPRAAEPHGPLGGTKGVRSMLANPPHVERNRPVDPAVHR